MDPGAAVIAIPGPDPFAFIDLARRGRTGVWVFARAIGRFILYVLGGIVVAVGVLFLLNLVLPGTLQRVLLVPLGQAGLPVELSFILFQSLLLLWVIRDVVVRTHRRPFLTLVSADGRIDERRILAGAAAWLLAALVVIPLSGIVEAWLDPAVVKAAQFRWPGLEWGIAVVPSILLIMLQSGGEELIFRGWLTQTIGQWLRNRVVLALVIGTLFALAHGFSAGPLALPYYIIVSLGLSALSLRDRRLELAIGAHTAQNLFVLLASPLIEGRDTPTLLGSEQEQVGLLALAAAAAQTALVYWLCGTHAFRRLFRLDARS